MERIPFAKTIKLFLIDGSPNGRISAELSNWTGKAYKLPRKMVMQSFDRDDLTGTGVYMLFGTNPDDNKDMVYVGESEEVYKRLRSHLDKKEFWNYAVVIVSKDDNLNKAHLKYLESKMYEQAGLAGRFSIDNANEPTRSTISESDVAEMEEFFSNMALLVSTLGFKVFDALKQISTKPGGDEVTFYVKSSRGADAQGQQTTEGFVVFQGSAVAGDVVDSFKGDRFQGAYNLRLKLIEDKVIKKEQEDMKFTQDYLFSSPSAAAMIVLGRSANGLIEWKTAEGKKLKDIEKI